MTAKSIHPLTQLPFVCDTPEDREHPRKFWCATPSGDYIADCEMGGSYGLAALRHMRDHDSPPLLGDVVSSMIRSKGATERSNDGVVIGFCTTVAYAAIAGSNEVFLRRLERRYQECAELIEGAS